MIFTKMFRQKKIVRLSRPTAHSAAGFTLLEALVTIGLVAMLLSVFTALITAVHYVSYTRFNFQAASFIQEGLESLRIVDFDDLTDREDGRLLGQAFNRGHWAVTDDMLKIAIPAPDLIDETGLAVLPGSYRNDFTFTAQVRADAGSPVGWGTGIALRYRDSENHYRYRFTSGGLAFDRVYRGAMQTLWTQGGGFNPGIWYTLEVEAVGDQFVLKRNGLVLTTVTDATLPSGDLALLSLNGAISDFNDVTVSGDEPGSWNFDGDGGDELPEDWRRFGPFDLPGGNATLTISDYLAQSGMKQASMTVSWTEAGRPKTMTGSSIIIR
ncbi:hypothetical protein COY93_04150 [Candidatus Uhrbacteria bacterium CG_4_10_14_0_8_um_filter_58_22]|uniref:3-keto-disaccharide hydrolase domain-containing protein n=1 Tax=Candidatus Uhrbacteria bacterium CG_4_10_14_0_8_um_filter_58_22 TaxID=1975029 RepID=A0A2M7Q9X4_9BACT|nr:MAG: hypothetical protein AUJ19_04810 [Parcubacteria group bacterium CG1_02_58_44]PIY62031.1 MAG: hypothetical protein COY93_04150 [Candidatus Uhrbacteria bacterium CG_4_10_14_0_8_um_filter_58_22]